MDTPADASPLAALQALIDGAEYLYLTRLPYDDGDVLYQLSWRAGGRSHIEQARTFAELLRLVTGQGGPAKTCSRCRQRKDLDDFPRRPDRKDGRASHCLDCDRNRKSKWYPRSARKRPGQAPTSSVESPAPAPAAAPRSQP